MLIFAVVALSVVLATHAWLGFRLAAPFQGATTWLIWGGLVANAVALPLSMFLSRTGGDSSLSNGVAVLGFTLMGTWSVLVALMLGWEVLRLLAWIWDASTGLAGLQMGTDAWLPTDPAQRMLWARAARWGVLGVTALLGLAGVLTGLREPVVERTRVEIQDLPAALDGFRIVQISDLHVGPTNREAFIRRVVDEVNALEPDLVAVTGDLVDGPVDALRSQVAPLEDLRARHGAYFVTGNHEYYSGVHAWLGHVETIGMVPLVNEHRTLVHEGERVVVAGIPDHRAASLVPSHVPDPARSLVGAPEDAAVKLLLAHQPRSAPAAAEAGFDLVLAGHTHGGQYVPWTWIIHLVEPYIAGLYRIDETWLWVNRGTGTWGPPLRLGSPKEITVLELTQAS